MASAKIRTLLVYKLLNSYSDEEHHISSTKLISMLKDYGVDCERKSIYADVKALNALGCDIITAHSPRKGFFMGQRMFEIPELTLLIDAVCSANFITPKKTELLVDKLKTLMSVYQAESLTDLVYFDPGVAKCDNEEIYIVIDNLNEAITSKKKVKFKYKRRSVDTNTHARYTTKTYVVSPYALIWRDDHYYLVCNFNDHDNLVNLRVDRMSKLSVLDADVRPINEVSKYEDSLDVSDYLSTMFNMFSGDECLTTLEFHISLEEEIVDRFGRVRIQAVDGNHLKATVKASDSDGFVSWVMQFGDKVKVVEPASLAEKVRLKAQSIADSYK